MLDNSRPSCVRYVVVAVTTLSAVLLYLDRFCISFAERFIKRDLDLSDEQMAWMLSAFFWTYALGQVPSGWLADRFGARRMLTVYILLWSLFTALTGVAGGFAALLASRLAFGLAQAGAYPTSAGLLSNWIPFASRGLASSVVAFGGRIGGSLAPVLTAYLILWASWRESMFVYGAIGLAIAMVFWVTFRDRPDQHGLCNAAEIAAIESDRLAHAPGHAGVVGGVPWGPILRSRSLWLNCLMQWGTNVGWVFLVSWLPRYLEEVHEVPVEARGWMTSAPIFVGWFGMLCGGWLTDRFVPVLGLRWGRSALVVGSRLVAMGAYVVCLLPLSPWQVTIAFAVVAFGTDVGIGAVWAFQQDVGGRHVGSVLGWGNMWGNLGAALSPPLLNWAVKHYGWDAAFMVCAAGFLVSGLAALGIDATKRIVPDDESRSADQTA
jgi:ACS family glucarate transporter-like MFS transporter